MTEHNEPLMRWFEYSHLPLELQSVSARFRELAAFVCVTCPVSAERTVALRKLLEAKDAAVRAKLPVPQSVTIQTGGEA